MEKAKLIRIRPDTHKQLRLLAAMLEKSLIDTVDYAISKSYRNQTQKEPARISGEKHRL